MRHRDYCILKITIQRPPTPVWLDLNQRHSLFRSYCSNGIVSCSCVRRRPHQTKQNEAVLNFWSVVGMVEYTRNSALLSCATVNAAMNCHTKRPNISHMPCLVLYTPHLSLTSPTADKYPSLPI